MPAPGGEEGLDGERAAGVRLLLRAHAAQLRGGTRHERRVELQVCRRRVRALAGACLPSHGSCAGTAGMRMRRADACVHAQFSCKAQAGGAGGRAQSSTWPWSVLGVLPWGTAPPSWSSVSLEAARCSSNTSMAACFLMQARDLLQHLWTGPISNAPVDIVQVRAQHAQQSWRGTISRVSACARHALLSPGLGGCAF